MRSFMRLTAEQNLTHQDMANPQQLNDIIWFSVRGAKEEMPTAAQLPAFDLMTAGLIEDNEEEREELLEKSRKLETVAKKILSKK